MKHLSWKYILKFSRTLGINLKYMLATYLHAEEGTVPITNSTSNSLKRQWQP